MKKIIWIIVLLLTLAFVSAAINRIVYPAANDVISRTKNVPLNITSTGSTSCYFSYSEGANQTINCDGISSVNFPDADGDYIITVGDTDDNWIKQWVTIKKPTGAIAFVIYFSTFALMIWMVLYFFIMLYALISMRLNIVHVGIAWTTYFFLLFLYEMGLEYANMPFLIDWLNLYTRSLGYVFIVAPMMFYIVLGMVNSLKHKKNAFLPDWEDRKL